MKKYILGIVLVLIVGILLSLLIFKKNGQSLSNEICDYSYQRYTDVDSETIRFGCDNSFSYFYGVGDPVEDSDLCETYSYDGEIIRLNCDGSSYDNKIKIISYDDKKIELLINGENRVFDKID